MGTTLIWDAGDGWVYFYTEERPLLTEVLALKGMPVHKTRDIATFSKEGKTFAWQITVPPAVAKRVSATVKAYEKAKKAKG